MADADHSEINAKVKKSLDGTQFESSELKPLSGGSVNWTYLAKLAKPLDDGTQEVMVKHGETHMMSRPDTALTLTRCRLEMECFKCMSNDPFVGKPDQSSPYEITVRTPKFYHFDEENTNQFLEFMPNGTTLKEYALKYYATPTPESLKPEAYQVGKSVGLWLNGFTQWSAGHPELRPTAAKNMEAFGFRFWLEFGMLADRVDQYPDVLGDVKDVFTEVTKMADGESKDESKLQIVHGDFWTGNVLIPDERIKEGSNTSLFVIDWEMAHLASPSVDYGQMVAEMFTFWVYKQIPAGLWMVEGLVEGYGKISEEFAFRTAIQVGCHIVGVIPMVGWGDEEETKKAVAVGRDIIVNAWKKDRAWFEKSDLASLFKQVS